MVEIVQLRDAPRLNDIPAQMRALADQIESGDFPAQSVLLIVPKDGDFPAIFGWGDHLGDYGNIGLLDIAKLWMMQNTTQRT